MEPDLNHLSATKVMGWVKHPAYSSGWFEYVNLEGESLAATYKGHWDPRTDMNQCMMVVDKMRELGWKYFRLEYPNEEEKEVYYTEFAKPNTYQSDNWAESDNRNDAILTAALKAIGALEET